jgi:hypothetical protein
MIRASLRAHSISRLSTLIALGLSLSLFGCSDNDSGDSPDKEAGPASNYALSSVVYGDDASSTYVNLLEDVDAEEVDFKSAREFAGSADMWWHEGALFITDEESRTITKYLVKDGKLDPQGEVNFGNFGLTSFGMWLNAFVAADKAYFLNGSSGYIVWNPETMEIGDTIDLPELPDREGLKAFPGYSDRASSVRDGLLYQPFYYTDETYFQFAPATSIVVMDIATDEVVDVLEAPCPGLDFATQDESHNIYFSSWVFAPGGAALLDQPKTCVAKLAAGSSELEKAFEVADVTEGREGGALRYLGDDKAILSVLHADNVESDDVTVVAYGANWRFWVYDLSDGSATQIDAIDWNAGAAYDVTVDGKAGLLVPAGDYASTQLYEVAKTGKVTAKLKSKGWSLRLFDLR